MNFLGIDLGTSSIKATLIDSDANVVATASRDNEIITPSEGFVEQDANMWYQNMIEILTEIAKDYKIDGISFSGQMHGLVMLDENDELLDNVILWNDSRSIKQCDYLNDEFNIFTYTKNYAFPGYTLPKLLWVKENKPAVFGKINKIMLPKDYLVYMLTKQFVSDYSDAVGTLMLTPENEWSMPIIEEVGITINNLPKIANSFAQIGHMQANLCELVGIDKAPMIICGGGDQAIAAISNGVYSPGQVSISMGTSGVVFSPKAAVSDNKSIHRFRDVYGEEIAMGVALSTGGSISWYKQLAQLSFDNLNSCLEKEYENNILFYPYLAGERTPIFKPNARGSFLDIDLSNNQMHMTRSVLEGVCFSLTQMFNELITDCDEVYVTGGATANSRLMQLLANLLNKKLYMIAEEAGASYGAAIVALSSIENKELNNINILKNLEKYEPETDVYISQKYQRWLSKQSSVI